MKTKMNQWFEKVHSVFLGVVVLVFALSLIVTACKSSGDGLPEDEPTELPGEDELSEVDPTEWPTVQRRLENQQLVALAVCRTFDGKNMSAKSSFQNMEKTAYLPVTRFNTDDNPLQIKYAFDFLEIKDAIHFIAQAVDFPFLNEICGEGEIEVFLTSFNTYVYADETKDENNLQLFIPDDLIVFRGEWGMYSCMNNGGSFPYDDMNSPIYSLIEYSSHKRFGDNSIDKDFTPPLYQFFVKIENDQTLLACRESNEVGYFPGQYLQWTILEGGNIISSEDLFSVESLIDMPEMTQQCTITDIGEDYFMVSGKYNLEKIFFDGYTLFIVDEQPTDVTNFAKGDIITVTYNKPYERYNPKVTVANRIMK